MPTESNDNLPPLSLKRRWIDNLRSGNFVQIVGRLRIRENCFCATGVLAMLPPECDSFNDVEKMIQLNDSGVHFREIADELEATL